MKIEAAVLYNTHEKLAVETLELAPPKKGEVLVKMGAAGVCHSDYHVVTGDAKQTLPCVLGHEGAGEVVEVGDSDRARQTAELGHERTHRLDRRSACG